MAEVWSALLVKTKQIALFGGARRAAWKTYIRCGRGVLRLIPLDGVLIREAGRYAAGASAVPLRTLDAIHSQPMAQ